MKFTLSMLCTAFILLSSFTLQKPGTEEIIITGLKFNKDRTAALRKIPKQPAFIIDNNGVVRATKNYQIIYEKNDNLIVILPKETTYSNFKKIEGYEDIKLSNGASVGCMCDGAYDNCHFDNKKKKEEFVCTGSCSCYIGLIFGLDNFILGYETAGGRWFNF